MKNWEPFELGPLLAICEYKGDMLKLADCFISKIWIDENVQRVFQLRWNATQGAADLHNFSSDSKMRLIEDTETYDFIFESIPVNTRSAATSSCRVSTYSRQNHTFIVNEESLSI
jgi:hypothetical protein